MKIELKIWRLSLAIFTSNQALDNQEHILACNKIKENLKELDENTLIKYEHIFEADVKILKPVIDLVQKELRIRKTLLIRHQVHLEWVLYSLNSHYNWAINWNKN